MGQLVNQTSFQFNGTVVLTFSLDMICSFFVLTGFEIFERSPGKQAVGSPLWSSSFSVTVACSIDSVAHCRTGADGAFFEGQAGHLDETCLQYVPLQVTSFAGHSLSYG
jgi:hypothetical protein